MLWSQEALEEVSQRSEIVDQLSSVELRILLIQEILDHSMDFFTAATTKEEVHNYLL